jgi:hypothetical protein
VLALPAKEGRNAPVDPYQLITTVCAVAHNCADFEVPVAALMPDSDGVVPTAEAHVTTTSAGRSRPNAQNRKLRS